MINKIVRALILIPLALVLIAFAVANRQTVTVSFDPFDQAEPAFAVALPLYVLILALVIAGVIIGGAAAWFRQGRWRGRARLAESKARELRVENEQLKHRDGSAPSRTPPAVDHGTRLSIPPPG